MAGESLVDVGLIAAQQFEHGTVVLNQRGGKARWLLEHGLFQRIIEFGEHLPIDGLALEEIAVLQPLAEELQREPADLGIFQHAANLGAQRAFVLQLSLGRQVEQFLVGHGGPEEIAQSRCQRQVGNRLDGFSRRRHFHAVAEMRRHQDADDARAHRLLDAVFLLPGDGVVELQQLLGFLGRQRPTIGRLREVLQVAEVGRLGLLQLHGPAFQPLADVFKKSMNRVLFQLRSRGCHVRALEIDLLEAEQVLFLAEVGIFLADRIEIGVLQEAPLFPFKEHKAVQHLVVDVGAEVQFVPQSIQVALLLVAEHGIAQRLIVAEEAFDQVKTGRDAAGLIDEIEPIGEQLAEGFAGGGELLGCGMAGGKKQRRCRPARQPSASG